MAYEKISAVVFYSALTWYIAPYVTENLSIDDERVGIVIGFLISMALYQQYIQDP